MSKFDNDWLEVYFEKGVDLLNRRIFIGDIEEDKVDAAIKGLYLIETESKTQPCEMFISSYGGNLYDALALYDIMQTVKCPIHTFAYGKVMSAAPLLLAAGEPGQRWCAQNVAFMHHDWSAELSGTGNALNASIKHNQELSKVWTNLLVKHSNRDKRFWNSKANQPGDFYFGADEAIEWGIADAIWSEK